MLYDGTDFYTQPPKLVEAVDTLGAGDSFAAAFLLAWLKRNGLKGLLDFCNDFLYCLVHDRFLPIVFVLLSGKRLCYA